MTKKQKLARKKNIWLAESTIRANHWDLSAFLSRCLRKKLAQAIYWTQPMVRGKVYWNWTLLQDYLINGDRPEHQALVEEYLATPPHE